MPDNIVERAIVPFNPASSKVLNKDKYNLFAPVADINKVGMAGFNPDDFSVDTKSIVSIKEGRTFTQAEITTLDKAVLQAAKDDTYTKTEIDGKDSALSLVIDSKLDVILEVARTKYNLLGNAPQVIKQLGGMGVLLIPTSAATITIKSYNVLNLTTLAVTVTKCTLETTSTGFTITKDGTNQDGWYSTWATMHITDLIPDRTYKLKYNTSYSAKGAIVYGNEPHAENTILATSWTTDNGGRSFKSFTPTNNYVDINFYISDPGGALSATYSDFMVLDQTIDTVDLLSYQSPYNISYQITSEDIIIPPATCTALISSDVQTEVLTEIDIDQISPLKAKTLVCFGDSITGNFTSPTDYPTFIANETGMNVINMGFGGCRMGYHAYENYDAFSMYNLADAIISGNFTLQDGGIAGTLGEGTVSASFADKLTILKTIDFNTVDYISIAYGTNDWGNNTPIDNTDLLSATSYRGATRYALSELLNAYPHLRVLLITPIYSYDIANARDSDSELWVRGTGNWRLTEYVDALIEMGKEFKVSVLNAYTTLGFNKYNWQTYLSDSDGTHPTIAGREKMGEVITSALLSVPAPVITPVDNKLTSTSTTNALSAYQGKLLNDAKQANLVSGTNIKSINGNSILGEGNIVISATSETATVDMDTAIQSITVENNTIYDSSVDITDLTIQFGTLTLDFNAIVNFASGAVATTLVVPIETIMKGDSCLIGVFTPLVNKRYSIGFNYNGTTAVGFVCGV